MCVDIKSAARVLVLLVLLLGNGFTPCLAQSGEYFVPKPKTAITYTDDSLIRFVASCGNDTCNLFTIKEDGWQPLVRQIRKFNRLMMFDAPGPLIVLHPEGVCVNYDQMIWHLAMNQTDMTRRIADYTQYFNRVTEGAYDQTKMTAVIFWTLSLGVVANDNPFEWERKLRKRFGNDLNIIKVNMDVNAAWTDSGKAKTLAIIQKVLDQTNLNLQ